MKKTAKSMHIIMVTLCRTFLLLLLPAVLSAGEYTYQYDFPKPTVKQIQDGRCIVALNDSRQHSDAPGAPLFPVVRARLFVSENERVVSIDVVRSELTVLPGNYLVQHAGEVVPLLDAQEIVAQEQDPRIYESDEDYPRFFYKDRGVQHYLGVQIVGIDLMPVFYNPRQGTITYCNKMTVSLHTEPKNEALHNVMPFRNLPKDKEALLAAIDNDGEFLTAGVSKLSAVPQESREYVVITTSELVSAFQTLTAFRESEAGGGYATHIETLEEIEATYTGIDSAEKIRNFIRQAYIQYGTRYVMLGGDCDGVPEQQIIPTRGMYAFHESYEDDYIPSDLYYGCLDGSWNGDGDNRWGEPNDGIDGGDIDWYSEVYIGRIAADNETEALNHISKIIAFETTPNPPYKTLLVGEMMYWKTWAGDRLDWVYRFMNDMPHATLYDRDRAPIYYWFKSEIMGLLNGNEFGWINHLGHSDNNENMRIFNADVASLTNTAFFFIYSQGCYCGSIDSRKRDMTYAADDCFGEVITNGYDDRGAFAYISNSRYGWYDQGAYVEGASNLAHKEFVEAVFADGIVKIGEANQCSKTDLPLHDSLYRWIAFNTNLLGDPATPLHVTVAPEENRIHVKAILPNTQRWWEYGRATMWVQVVDELGVPVAGATISGQWSGAVHDSDVVTTGGQGWAKCTSDWQRGNGSFTFCVTDVTKADWAYDPEANVLTCATSQ